MNRDKVLSLVLFILLVASLAGNWVLWRKSRGAAGPAVETAQSATQPATRKSPPPEKGDKAAYDVVANPEMKGRLGRIVIAFAGPANIKDTRTSFCKAGSADMVRTDYGIVAAELPPGKYDLEVCGKKLADVPVESGQDTRVHSGVLRLHGAKDTRFSVFNPGGQKFIHVEYGNAEFGLPVGDYEVEISGQREKVTIEPGKITDF